MSDRMHGQILRGPLQSGVAASVSSGWRDGEVAEPGSVHPAFAKMEPHGELPTSLVEEDT